jgi:hypothetical protein
MAGRCLVVAAGAKSGMVDLAATHAANILALRTGVSACFVWLAEIARKSHCRQER